MKCPKCGYISFDYNQVCPKCNKEISAQQAVLHLPAFRPNPPSLLGSLIGESNEADLGMGIDRVSTISPRDDADADIEDSEEIKIDEAQSLDISFESEDALEIQEKGEVEITFEEPALPSDTANEAMEISLEADETSLEDAEAELSLPDIEAGKEGISLDLGDLATEEPPSGELTPGEAADRGEELTIDLDDLSLDDSEDSGAVETEDLTMDLQTSRGEFEPVSAGGAGEIDGKQEDEIELTLDDLKINETGQLEISTLSQASEEAEQPLEVEGLLLEETEPEEEGLKDALEIGDIALQPPEAEGSTSEEILPADDLSLPEPEADWKGLDNALEIGGIPLEGAGSEEADSERTLVVEDLSLEDSGPQEEAAKETEDEALDFDLEGISLEESETSETAGKEEGDATLDLDDLDLDLDLDESKK